MLKRKLFAHLFGDRFWFHIAFGGDEAHNDIFIGVLFDLFQPFFYVFECGHLHGVVAQDDCLCALVVGLSDSTEAFLPGCIPNLHFNFRAIQFHRFHLEVNA